MPQGRVMIESGGAGVGEWVGEYPCGGRGGSRMGVFRGDNI